MDINTIIPALIVLFGLSFFIAGLIYALIRHIRVSRRARRMVGKLAPQPFDIYKAINDKRENHWMKMVFISRWFLFRLRRTWFKITSSTSPEIELITWMAIPDADAQFIKEELTRYGIPVMSVSAQERYIPLIAGHGFYFGTRLYIRLKRQPMVTETKDSHSAEHVYNAGNYLPTE